MLEWQGALALTFLLSAPALGVQLPEIPDALASIDKTWSEFWNGPECQKLKPANCGENSEFDALAYCPELHWAYTKNPKANSKGIKRYMSNNCPGEVYPKDKFASLKMSLSDASYAFTFVREPFARTVSGYAEIDAKTERERKCIEAINRTGTATFWKIPRGQEPERFEAFLDDIRHGRIPEECEPHHGGLQTEVACGVPKQALRAIGCAENFSYHMPVIYDSAMKAEEHQRRTHVTAISLDEPSNLLGDIPSVAASTYRALKDGDKWNVKHSATAKTRQLVCDMYRADYVCFNYPLPTECMQ
jgi:hypothetical protein